MFEKIISLDKQILIYLNNLGSPQYDNLWLMITKPIYWTPFFLILLYLIFKKLGAKQGFIILGSIALIILVNDQTTNLIREIFKRLRPCNDPSINQIIRLMELNPATHELYKPVQFSFVSGHSSNSMATMLFLFLILKKHYKNLGFIFIFPLIFAYSRIYCGVHFPIDILGGFTLGSIFAILFYKVYNYFQTKIIF
jgi:undecaprenyl-diphosphatase